jgi:hypothetical protein
MPRNEVINELIYYSNAGHIKNLKTLAGRMWPAGLSLGGADLVCSLEHVNLYLVVFRCSASTIVAGTS